MTTYTITVTKGQDGWSATVEPPLNDGGPFKNWPSARALLEAIAESIENAEDDR